MHDHDANAFDAPEFTTVAKRLDWTPVALEPVEFAPVMSERTQEWFRSMVGEAR